ncbi:MAG: hypothetical protein ACTSWK_16775, partial [Promethearchaeota archaeon]
KAAEDAARTKYDTDMKAANEKYAKLKEDYKKLEKELAGRPTTTDSTKPSLETAVKENVPKYSGRTKGEYKRAIKALEKKERESETHIERLRKNIEEARALIAEETK